jgi:hypothetical protein
VLFALFFLPVIPALAQTATPTALPPGSYAGSSLIVSAANPQTIIGCAAATYYSGAYPCHYSYDANGATWYNSSYTGGPHWLQVTLAVPVVVSEWTISAHSSGFRFPNMVIQAYDGSGWVDTATYTGIAWSSDTEVFDATTTTTYSSNTWRIYVTGISALVITEMSVGAGGVGCSNCTNSNLSELSQADLRFSGEAVEIMAYNDDGSFMACINGICDTRNADNFDPVSGAITTSYQPSYVFPAPGGSGEHQLTLYGDNTYVDQITVLSNYYPAAQGGTATPVPNPTTTPAATPDVSAMTVLYPGFYESSDGAISRAGDWLAADCGGLCQQDNEILYTDVNGTMHIRFYGDGITIARLVGPGSGQMELCANGWCSLVDNYDPGAMAASDHTLLLRPGYYHVSLRNASVTGARLSVDAVTVHDDSAMYTVPTPTPFPTATPNGSIISDPVTIGGEDYESNYIMSITAGEVAIVAVLTIIAAIGIGNLVLWLWHRN